MLFIVPMWMKKSSTHLKANWHPTCIQLRKELASYVTNISKPPRVHLPITSDIMQEINTVLSAEPDSYFNKMILAACCMAFFGFFGFLHSSGFTVLFQHHYDPEVHLSLSDIIMDRWCFPTMVCIQYILNSPKLDSFGRIPTYVTV